ncbi:MAG: nucleotidyl transferase AbiEii/AbiGii toxin family protein [Holosporales bacterium]|jgi:predicted nucleotidyltransferase component of viral defense system
MIPKAEILRLATESSLQPHVIEKDYVLGWLLAGIHQHPILNTSWVFKGGTCLKKCYFETYRFSEDLDFTLQEAAHLEESFLQSAFKQIAEWVYETSGIEIISDKTVFDSYKTGACQGRLYYRGPVTPSGNRSVPRIKLDLTVNEIIAAPTVVNAVRHDYSDIPAQGIAAQCYSYVEVFAEKIRALKERTRPRDLYDVINFFRRPESAELGVQVKMILEKKCAFKNISFPEMPELEAHREECAAGWRDQLSHQLQTLPPFESFWEELHDFFNWLGGAPKRILESLPVTDAIYTGSWASLATPTQRVTLEHIRFAAVNQLLLTLDYRKENGIREQYRIEPYSLRRTADGNIILYAIKQPSGQTRAFRIDRILNAQILQEAFKPHFVIDFLPAGPVTINSAPFVEKKPKIVHTKTTAQRSFHQKGTSGIKYVFKCTVCGKTFAKSNYNSALNPHKNKQGYPCFGSIGNYVKTRS